MDRRRFIRLGSLGGAYVSLSASPGFGAQFMAQPDDRLKKVDVIDKTVLLQESRALATRAIDAAHQAGAHYADVRLTHDIAYQAAEKIFGFNHAAAVGVRALVDGCWGFASSPNWTDDEMDRLARQAVAQAHANRWGISGPVQFVDSIEPARGDWTMPIEQDPIDIPINEQADWLAAVVNSAEHLPRKGNPSVGVYFGVRRQQKTFASTQGALCTQTLYAMFESSSALELEITHPITKVKVRHRSQLITPAGKGWEAIRKIDIDAVLSQLYEEAWLLMESRPVSIGRYDIVFDASATAALIHETIGIPLQIDRARGYEANAAGTSYLNFDEQQVGAQISSSLLNVTGHRNQPGGIATTRWDDEGVTPDAITLVREGVIEDYATSREHIAGIRDGDDRNVRSNGCAGAENALGFPLVQSPNLEIQPSDDTTTFESMVAGMENGFAVIGGDAMMDQQQLTGVFSPGIVREIKNGKLGPVAHGAGLLFRSPELWKNLSAVGGAGSGQWRGFQMSKGQPDQSFGTSVNAVPVVIQNLAIIDVSRQLMGV